MAMLPALLLSLAVVTQAPLDDQPPWEPFPAERDVPVSPRKRALQVAGVISLVAGVASAGAGTLLGVPAALVAGGSARLLALEASLPLGDSAELQQARTALVVVGVVAGAGVLIAGAMVGVGALLLLLGFALSVYAALTG